LLDLVSVGHFAIDLIVSPKIDCPKLTLGGPAAFVSLTAAKLGAKVGVVSKVGEDFQEHLTLLRENNVDLSLMHITENTSSTHFVLTYSKGRRKLQLKSKAPRISPQDIPSALRANAIHVAPVVDELSVEVIKELRDKTPALSIDPQGFLRRFDKTGMAKLETLDDIGFLQYFDVFKSSIQELKVLTGHSRMGVSMETVCRAGVEIILVTMGIKGSLIRFGEKFYHVPSCKPKTLKDPTGAGDAFIGGFLAEYIRGEEPLWCCCVGSAAASFVIEKVGSQRFGEKDEVYERATKIYEKGIKPLSSNSIL